MVQAASVTIHGPHGQHIENVHLQPYDSDDDFWERLYPRYHSQLFQKAETFLGNTVEDDVMIFIRLVGFSRDDFTIHSLPTL